mmetsp:Transcript_72267/g.197892  ORF Transcript_72267/g.197892 Transcript_72267/m.197892 type:complete len:203 (+) Transcript_72267:647-1255(+)
MRTSALNSRRLKRVMPSPWPSTTSSSLAIGKEMGHVRSMRVRTSGASDAAIWSCLGPVMTADGRISPKMSTHVTEMMIALFSSTSRSRKMGSASLATALQRRRETRRWWWAETTGSTLPAHSCSDSEPPSSLRLSVSGSSDRMPIVQPAARPAKQTSPMQMQTSVQYSASVSSSSSSAPSRRAQPRARVALTRVGCSRCRAA